MGVDTNKGRGIGISHTVFQKTYDEKQLLKDMKNQFKKEKDVSKEKGRII